MLTVRFTALAEPTAEVCPSSHTEGGFGEKRPSNPEGHGSLASRCPTVVFAVPLFARFYRAEPFPWMISLGFHQNCHGAGDSQDGHRAGRQHSPDGAPQPQGQGLELCCQTTWSSPWPFAVQFGKRDLTSLSFNSFPCKTGTIDLNMERP